MFTIYIYSVIADVRLLL